MPRFPRMTPYQCLRIDYLSNVNVKTKLLFSEAGWQNKNYVTHSLANDTSELCSVQANLTCNCFSLLDELDTVVTLAAVILFARRKASGNRVNAVASVLHAIFGLVDPSAVTIKASRAINRTMFFFVKFYQ